MTTARARRRIEPLPFIKVYHDRPLTLFSDLNKVAESFPRLAADRIARLDDLSAVEKALADVPREWNAMVTTLALQKIAERIAKIQPVYDTAEARALALEQRRVELAKIPGDLRGRVEPWVRSYYVTRPWLAEGKSKAGAE